MKVGLECGWCGTLFEKEKGEVNRQIRKGRKSFFCSLSCGAKWHNAQRDDLKEEIEKRCPVCKEPFKTMTGAKSSTFCSRSCASKGSMSEERRHAQSLGGKQTSENLNSPSDTLKKRESWKYIRVRALLEY